MFGAHAPAVITPAWDDGVNAVTVVLHRLFSNVIHTG